MSKKNCHICNKEGWIKDSEIDDGTILERLCLKMNIDNKQFEIVCLDCLEKISQENHK